MIGDFAIRGDSYGGALFGTSPDPLRLRSSRRLSDEVGETDDSSFRLVLVQPACTELEKPDA